MNSFGWCKRKPQTTAAGRRSIVPGRSAAGFFHINLNEGQPQSRTSLGWGLKRLKNSVSLLFRDRGAAIAHGELHATVIAVHLNVNLAALARPMLRDRQHIQQELP